VDKMSTSINNYYSFLGSAYGNGTEGAIYTGGSWTPLVDSPAIPINQWTHVVFTYNRVNAKIYINGVLVNTTSRTSVIDTSNYSLVLGGKSTTDRTRDFNGSLDDVTIYNKALTAEQINGIYAEGHEYYDNENIDFNFRTYNPSTYQFTQPDTLIQNVYDPQMLNRYAFERNNPYNREDPSGHFVFLIPIIVAVVVYAATYAAGNAAVDYGLQTYDLMHNQKMSYKDARKEILNNPDRQSSIKNSAKSGAIWGGVTGGAGEALNQISIRSGGSSSASTTQKVNVDKISVDNKLSGYSLNMNHPEGKNKATVFQSRLGYNSKNYGGLSEQISSKFDPKSAYNTVETPYGTKYSQIMSITGENGQTADVVTSWMVASDQARLVTAYVK